MGISDPGQDLSFSGAALTLLSALGSTEESSLFRTRRMNVLVSVNAPSATFREHFSVHRFSFRFSSWPRSPPTFGHCLRSCVLPRIAVEEKRNRSNTNRERHFGVVSMNYHLADRSWPLMNSVYYLDLLGLLWIIGFAWVSVFCDFVFASFFCGQCWFIVVGSSLLLALLDSFSLPFMLDK